MNTVSVLDLNCVVSKLRFLDPNQANKFNKTSKISLALDNFCTRYAGHCYPAFKLENHAFLMRDDPILDL